MSHAAALGKKKYEFYINYVGNLHKSFVYDLVNGGNENSSYGWQYLTEAGRNLMQIGSNVDERNADTRESTRISYQFETSKRVEHVGFYARR